MKPATLQQSHRARGTRKVGSPSTWVAASPLCVLLLVLVCCSFPGTSWSVYGDDLRPVCQSEIHNGTFELTLLNLTPQVTNNVLRSFNLNSSQWDVVATFVATGVVH